MQKIAILGFGVEGQDAAKFFDGKSKITVFDKKKKQEIIKGGWEGKNITWVCGEEYLDKGLQGFDLIVRSPGVYRYLPEIVEAEKSRAKITSTTKVFFDKCKTPIIGITGTKGKGTVARMLSLAMKKCGKKVVLAGNIGEPMLASLPKANKADWVILELSSFQTIDLHKSPQIAVVTNIAVEHQDWHKDDREYMEAKANLWKYQNKDDFAVFNADDEKSQEFVGRAKSQVLEFSLRGKIKGSYRKGNSILINIDKGVKVGRKDELKIPGDHILSDALAALTAATAAGCNAKKAWQGIVSYKGAEHRMEKVEELGRVIFVNDSAATNPESAVAAIKAFAQPKVLITGGSSKKTTFDLLAESVVKNNVKAVLLLGETSGEIEVVLKKQGYKGILEKGFRNMEEIVKRAKDIAISGDVVLLSPACASFGMFENYQERGEKFKKAVLKNV